MAFGLGCLPLFNSLAHPCEDYSHLKDKKTFHWWQHVHPGCRKDLGLLDQCLILLLRMGNSKKSNSLAQVLT